MAEFPSLEIFTDAYLADTGDLTLEEHGAYHLMLYTAWRRPDNALLNDMEWLKRALAAHCKTLHGRTFNALVPRLLHRFWALDPQDGKWHQRRLDKEREFRSKFSRNQSENATKGWQKRRETLAQNNLFNGLSDATALPPGNTPHPTPLGSTESYPSTSSPPPDQKSKSNGFRGGGAGRSAPTIEDPRERMVRFQERLAKALGPEGHSIVDAAANPAHALHLRCLAVCKAKARDAPARGGLGVKEWPFSWHLLYPKPGTKDPPSGA